jgi:hypothetical protein
MVPKQPPKTTVIRSVKIHMCQEPAIVSKPAEMRKSSVTLYESSVFLFYESVTELSKKHKPHGRGILQTSTSAEDTAALKRRVLPLALSLGPVSEWPI